MAIYHHIANKEAMLDQVGLTDSPGELLEGMDLAGSPRMAEFASRHVLAEGYSFASSFEVGLDLVLDALQRLRSAYP